MTDPSRNVQFGTFSAWTQEEFDRPFGGEMSNIDIIIGYVVDQSMLAPTEAGNSRYRLEDFTKSQLVEGEEYVPST